MIDETGGSSGPGSRPSGQAASRLDASRFDPSRESPALDFTDKERRIIGQMLKAERTLPDDFWHTAAVQELACIAARYDAIMTDEHCAALVGIGAILARHGKREMTAEIHARIALANARGSM